MGEPRRGNRIARMAFGVSLLLGNALPAQRMPTMSVFIVAHPDDWQLFMGDVAVRHLARDDRALFIVVSAGDAGRDATYWQARESGAVASMRAALALTEKPANRAVTRFLRLPDGKPDGTGFSTTGFQSLQKLERHLVPQLVTIDGATRYADVTDIMRELRAIIRRETNLGLFVHIHTHDPDLPHNPGDHADHRSVGRLALALGEAMHVPVTLYSGYVNIRRPDNLNATDAARKAYLFVTYDRARMAVNVKFSAYCENPWAHVVYLSRTYARPAPLAESWLFQPMHAP
jgi:LmbE family N-acetylglucosaminyl deacetylase